MAVCFLIHGKSPMILDVVVSVGFCVMLVYVGVKLVNAFIYRQQNEQN